jgi:type IV pilus assembly protein PilO
MSSAAVVPSSKESFLRQIPQLTARARTLLTAMNLHYAGVALLVVLDLYLALHLVFVGQALKAHNVDALDQQNVQLRSAELAAKPLRGLDAKLVTSTKDADTFYAKRLPYADSQVLTELGALTKRAGVRWSRAQYTQNAVLSGADALTEMHMDASVSGDYRPIMLFINSIERDKMFFVINSINLSGQQTGQVNLRIRLATFLRQPTLGEMTAELPGADAGKDAGKDASTPVVVDSPGAKNAVPGRGGRR